MVKVRVYSVLWHFFVIQSLMGKLWRNLLLGLWCVSMGIIAQAIERSKKGKCFVQNKCFAFFGIMEATSELKIYGWILLGFFKGSGRAAFLCVGAYYIDLWFTTRSCFLFTTRINIIIRLLNHIETFERVWSLHPFRIRGFKMQFDAIWRKIPWLRGLNWSRIEKLSQSLM